MKHLLQYTDISSQKRKHGEYTPLVSPPVGFKRAYIILDIICPLTPPNVSTIFNSPTIEMLNHIHALAWFWYWL